MQTFILLWKCEAKDAAHDHMVQLDGLNYTSNMPASSLPCPDNGPDLRFNIFFRMVDLQSLIGIIMPRPNSDRHSYLIIYRWPASRYCRLEQAFCCLIKTFVQPEHRRISQARSEQAARGFEEPAIMGATLPIAMPLHAQVQRVNQSPAVIQLPYVLFPVVTF